MNSRIKVALLGVFAYVSMGLAQAQSVSVVVPQLSPTATDFYKTIIQTILEAGGKTATIQVLPFARAVYMMENNQADILSALVQIPDQKKWVNLKYDYATSDFVKIVFVLYTNKSKPINAADLKNGNAKSYKIETDAAHVDHFSFAALPSTSIDASLKKVDSGAVDGFIFAQGSTDAALKRLGLKNIARSYYGTYSNVFILQKGTSGGSLDKVITDGLAKIKANGKYQEIVGPYAGVPPST